MISKKATLLDCSLILLMGMVPLLWFMKDAFIISADFTLPFTFTRWFDEYFHMWNHHLGAGISYRLIESSHFFFLIQILFQALGLDLLETQRLVFVFWFLLPGLSFYILARYLFRELNPKHRRIASLVGVSFYMFNLYLEPIWIGLNVANLLAYAFLPLLLRLWLTAIEQKKNPILYGFWVACLTLPASGIFCNPAILIISFIPFVLFTLFALIKLKPGIKDLFRVGTFILATAFFVVAFNFYWILPEYSRIFFNPETQGKALSSGIILKPWLEGVSKFTSFTNVLRMQGDWTWYAGYRTYANVFQHNWLYLFLGWMLPILALIGMLVKNRYRFAFALLLIGSIFFSMGIHSFFGPIYWWCVDHIPLFWVIRSPWYKFGLLTCMGYAFFLGLAATKVVSILEKRNWARFSVAAFLVLFLFSPIYAFPLTIGKIFKRPQEGGYSNHFIVPEYVKEAANWVNGKEGDFRIFDLPGKGVWHNRWGYQGFTPYGSYVFDQPMLYIDHALSVPKHGTWTTPWSHLVIVIQNALEKNLSPNMHRLLALFNVNTLLFEKDYKFETLPLPKKPEEIEANLNLQYGMHLKKSFGGKWDIYQVDETMPSIYIANKTTYVEDHVDTFIPLSNLEGMPKGVFFFASLTDQKTKDKLFQENLIDEVVLHDKTLFDFAVDLFPAESDIVIFKAEENPDRKANFFVSQSGSYQVFAKKNRPLSYASLRPLVDQTPLPQTDPIPWDPEKIWIQFNGKRLTPEEIPDKVSQQYDHGEGWTSLGIYSFPVGQQTLQITGEEEAQSSYEIKIISLEQVDTYLALIENTLKNPNIGFRNFITTNNAWNHNAQESVNGNPLVDSENITWEIGEALQERFPFRGNENWIRLNEGKVALKIKNTSQVQRAIKVYLELFIAQPHERTLYVYQNDKEVWQQSLEKHIHHKFLFPLKLIPGENLITFHTNSKPIKLDKLFHDGDQRKVNFLIQNVAVGDKVFQGQFDLPGESKVQIRVYPFKEEKEGDLEWKSPLSRRVQIDGKKLKLLPKTQSSGSRYWEADRLLKLNPGWHEVSLKEIEGNGYFIEIDSQGVNPTHSGLTPLDYEQVSPTEYKGKIQNVKSGWLVFNEAFDPRWELTSRRKNQKPVLVNGYANGYYLKNIKDESSFQLYFSIQSLLYKGLIVSGSLFGLTLLGFILWGMLRKRRRVQTMIKED